MRIAKPRLSKWQSTTSGSQPRLKRSAEANLRRPNGIELARAICEALVMSRASIRTAVLATAIALAFVPNTAFAYSWMYISQEKELVGTTGEEEGDTDFRASCKANQHAEIGIGAEEDVGTGKGEAVSVTLKTGERTLRIEGTSHNSPNFEMTAGVELQTAVDGRHEIFQLLTEPGTIKVTGATRPASWPAGGRAAATKAFVHACFGDTPKN